MDLSKAFDYLSHNLLIAKLGAYGLEKTNLRLLIHYLTSCEQQINIFSSCGNWTEIKSSARVHTGTLIIQCIHKRLFLSYKSLIFASLLMITSLHPCRANLKTVLENLEHDARTLLFWFKINSMKTSSEKFQFTILNEKSYQPQNLFTNTLVFNESKEV